MGSAVGSPLNSDVRWLMNRVPMSVLALLMMVGCTTLGKSAEIDDGLGLSLADLRCAHRVYVPNHEPSPNAFAMPMDPKAATQLGTLLRRAIPEWEVVDDPSRAELFVTVMLQEKDICTHCPSKPPQTWFGIVARADADSAVPKMITLSGGAVVGYVRLEDFVRQLSSALRKTSRDCQDRPSSPR
jgi:hypothetical protein